MGRPQDGGHQDGDTSERGQIRMGTHLNGDRSRWGRPRMGGVGGGDISGWGPLPPSHPLLLTSRPLVTSGCMSLIWSSEAVWERECTALPHNNYARCARKASSPSSSWPSTPSCTPTSASTSVTTVTAPLSHFSSCAPASTSGLRHNQIWDILGC